MTEEQRTLTDALRVIQSTCAEHDECRDCPLADAEGNCWVQDGNAPMHWHIATDCEVWRALR